MDYLEFTARVTSHIPDKGQVMVRYYGLYANAQFISHLQLTFAAEKPRLLPLRRILRGNSLCSA